MRGVSVFGWVLLLCASTSAEEYKTVTGPFRVQLLSLHRQRDLMLVHGPWVWVDDDGGQRLIDRKTPKSRSNGGPSFYARLRIATEPRTLFRQDGPMTLAEAVDDEDQTLEPAPAEVEEARRRIVPRPGAYPSIDIRLPLSLPDQPGKTVKRLRGTIPVVFAMRSAEPIAVVALNAAKGRRIEAGDLTLTVLDIKTDAKGRSVTTLLARLNDVTIDPRDREGQARVNRRLLDVAQQQIDLVDDQTRPVPLYPPSTYVKRNEVRITLRIAPGDEPHGAPDRLRVFGLQWRSQELPFDFKGVPLP